MRRRNRRFQPFSVLKLFPQDGPLPLDADLEDDAEFEARPCGPLDEAADDPEDNPGFVECIEVGFPTGADLLAASRAMAVFQDLVARGDVEAAEAISRHTLAVTRMPADFFTVLSPASGESVH